MRDIIPIAAAAFELTASGSQVGQFTVGECCAQEQHVTPATPEVNCREAWTKGNGFSTKSHWHWAISAKIGESR